MILKRFYEERLAQASYLVGCAAAGEAIVVDPNRDIAQYIDAARREGLRIVGVTETHIHADFASGTRALAQATGAMIYVSGEGGPDWQYEFARKPNVNLLYDGDLIRVGNVKLQAIHTPGHTDEHLTFLLTDQATGEEPLGAFTGDFLFVGDVGRPDLLEKAAGITGTMVESAKRLYHSLKRLERYPDYLMIWPAHGAGSACGKNLGGTPASSLGYERITNWAFRLLARQAGEDEFVKQVLDGQPEPPKYFAEMKRVNKAGMDPWNGFEPRSLTPKDRQLLDEPGAVLVDLRSNAEFAKQFYPGSLTIPLSRNFTTWAGSLLKYDQTVYFLAPSDQHAQEAAHALSNIGMDNIGGTFDPSLLSHVVPGKALQIEAEALATSGRRIVDVRKATEFREGHIPDAIHLPLSYLEKEIAGHPELIARDTPIAVYCSQGPRSALAASLLKRLRYTDVVEINGGFDAYREFHRINPGMAPIETGQPEHVTA